jgi:hypothetical protein
LQPRGTVTRQACRTARLSLGHRGRDPGRRRPVMWQLTVRVRVGLTGTESRSLTGIPPVRFRAARRRSPVRVPTRQPLSRPGTRAVAAAGGRGGRNRDSESGYPLVVQCTEPTCRPGPGPPCSARAEQPRGPTRRARRRDPVRPPRQPGSRSDSATRSRRIRSHCHGQLSLAAGLPGRAGISDRMPGDGHGPARRTVTARVAAVRLG